MDIEELKSVYLDVEKGVLEVNGQELKNVTEFSMTFKDGEFGLSVSHMMISLLQNRWIQALSGTSTR